MGNFQQLAESLDDLLEGVKPRPVVFEAELEDESASDVSLLGRLVVEHVLSVAGDEVSPRHIGEAISVAIGGASVDAGIDGDKIRYAAEAYLEEVLDSLRHGAITERAGTMEPIYVTGAASTGTVTGNLLHLIPPNAARIEDKGKEFTVTLDARRYREIKKKDAERRAKSAAANIGLSGRLWAGEEFEGASLSEGSR